MTMCVNTKYFRRGAPFKLPDCDSLTFDLWKGFRCYLNVVLWLFSYESEFEKNFRIGFSARGEQSTFKSKALNTLVRLVPVELKWLSLRTRFVSQYIL